MKTQYNLIIEKWAQNMAQHMQGNKETNKSVIAYGFQVFIFSGLTVLVTLLTAFFLGILVTTATALLASGSLRVVTGGYHCSNPFGCMLLTVASMNLYGFVTMNFTNEFRFSQLVVMLGIIMFLCLVFILKKAPVETPNKPIKAERRPVLKKIGLRVWFFWVLLLFTLILFKYDDYSHIVLAAGLGIASQTFSISGILKK